jgi:hypothetical protein
MSYPYGNVVHITITKGQVVRMATFVPNAEVPMHGQWNIIDGEEWWLDSREFRRNRCVCLMSNLDGFSEYFIFEY